MDAQYLSKVNDKKVFDIHSEEFKTYGNIVVGIDFSSLEPYMNSTTIPQDGNLYVPSTVEMESLPIAGIIKNEIYGGLEIQIGYCNGRNSTCNGFEYHKCSEITYAVTDFVLMLGHTWDMKDNTYNVEDAQLFFVKAGTSFELFQTSLHLAPCKVTCDGFKAVIILAKGTNTADFEKVKPSTKEGEILLMKNKWIICHKDREPLVKSGAKIGVIGDNRQIKY
ncbi:MAG: DUF4867 family protein [Bacillota bacterium]